MIEYQCGDGPIASSSGASFRLVVRAIHRWILLGCGCLTDTNKVEPAEATS